MIMSFERHNLIEAAREERIARALAIAHIEEIEHHRAFAQRYGAAQPAPNDGEEAGAS
jgi:hypothetical protein